MTDDSVRQRLGGALSDVRQLASLLARFEDSRDPQDLRLVTRGMTAMAAELKQLAADQACRTAANQPLLQQLSAEMRQLVARTKDVSAKSSVSGSANKATPDGDGGRHSDGGGGGTHAEQLDTPQLLRGWLKKQGEDLLHAWKTRYFVQSDDGSELLYFAREEDSSSTGADKTPLGRIDIREAREVLPGGRGLFNLALSTGRTYHLCVVGKGEEASQDQLRWIRGLDMWIRWNTRQRALRELSVGSSTGIEDGIASDADDSKRRRSTAFSVSMPQAAAASFARDSRPSAVHASDALAEPSTTLSTSLPERGFVPEPLVDVISSVAKDGSQLDRSSVQHDIRLGTSGEAESVHIAEFHADATETVGRESEAPPPLVQAQAQLSSTNRDVPANEKLESASESASEPSGAQVISSKLVLSDNEQAQDSPSPAAIARVDITSFEDGHDKDVASILPFDRLLSNTSVESIVAPSVSHDASPAASLDSDEAEESAAPKLPDRSTEPHVTGRQVSPSSAASELYDVQAGGTATDAGTVAGSESFAQADRAALEAQAAKALEAQRQKAAQERARIEREIAEEASARKTVASKKAPPVIHKQDSVVFERTLARVEQKRERKNKQKAAELQARLRQEEHDLEQRRLEQIATAAELEDLERERARRALAASPQFKSEKSDAQATESNCVTLIMPRISDQASDLATVVKTMAQELSVAERQILDLQARLAEKEAALQIAEETNKRTEAMFIQLQADIRAKDDHIRALTERGASVTLGRHEDASSSRHRSMIGLGNTLSHQLSAELDSRTHDVARLQAATWAHQRHSSELSEQLRTAEERCAAIVKAERTARLQLVQEMDGKMLSLQHVREKYLEQQLGLLDSDSLIGELVRLKKEYFFSLALSLKLSLFHGNNNFDVMELFEEAERSDLAWIEWPAWLSTQMAKAAGW